MSFVVELGPALPIIVGAFVVAALISLLATPVIRRVVDRLSIIDHPDERRTHASPLPRGGGVAVAVAFLVVGGGLVLVGGSLPGMPGRGSVSDVNLLGLFGGGILATVIGALDDRFDLRARWQFLGQLVLAVVAVVTGITVGFIGDPFGSGIIRFAAPIGIAFTVVWIVGMINSLNFIDGLDGLSTGIALIAAVTLGLLSLTQLVNEPLVAILCFVLAGGLLGFLRWNFHPAVIFQGSAGVMFMGYVLAVLAILGSAKVLVALLVLAVPIIDTFWVIVRRVSSGRSPFSPDRGHIHHRLLDLGLSHRSTVLLIYLVCATLGLMSLLVSSATGVLAFLVALVGFGVVAFVLRRDPAEAAS
ncbi:MAG: undecaprenyl/decaprenyl-phosphate alpha-N-acetylglucosaminyl 1-phosphate transferase [Chloroflexi bacterium]|nr:undecaprenyl/decaprenyl-phosphate alpha-N-acetylglucosaminyl 1-phosphate transferase [Chloroflexota bacterium]